MREADGRRNVQHPSARAPNQHPTSPTNTSLARPRTHTTARRHRLAGMAGSGKTTLIQRINSHLHARKLPGYIINLDPAVTQLPYSANIDIRDTVRGIRRGVWRGSVLKGRGSRIGRAAVRGRRAVFVLQARGGPPGGGRGGWQRLLLGCRVPRALDVTRASPRVTRVITRSTTRT